MQQHILPYLHYLFSGIFSVVKFANDACQSADTAYNGTCMTSTECTVNMFTIGRKQ